VKLVYKATGAPVRIGDTVPQGKVVYFRAPHKASAEGRVTVQTGKRQVDTREYYASVIGAVWIEREDRA
jgi:hypothetical protein